MSEKARPDRRVLAKLGLAVAAPVVFFGLLELVLVVGGVEPVVKREDPFVGFSRSVPLFVPERTADGEEWLVTSDAKLELFNSQRFPRRKAAGTMRVFCLGGSTTYGRPYTDETSFAGWLRVILPRVDPDRRWEVINAGGISYASYRVANLMSELEQYEPDLFIVYTGHNEFLEERTYASLRSVPEPLRALSGRLAKTRTWTAMSAVLRRVELIGGDEAADRFMLPEAVAAKLDQSAGLDLYERDDLLRERIVGHYRTSLERMIAMARSSGVGLVFVTPASNLRSFSPFKNEPTAGVESQRLELAGRQLEIGRRHNAAGDWAAALEALDRAVDLDPRFAELHYERGRALFGSGRFGEAREALERARDEDVCPLRALSEMRSVLEDVARATGTPLVDFIDLLERDLERRQGHSLLGEEDFLDHVHPTIDGHLRLAVALVEAMRDERLLSAGARLDDDALAEIRSGVEQGLDPVKQAEALASLAWTLDWAGKREDSRRIALKALATGVETPRVLLIAGRHAALDGDFDGALGLFHRAVRADPLSPTPHYQMGLLAIDRGELEVAAGQFFLTTVLWPHDAKAHEKLGLVMAERGYYDVAVASLSEAKRRDPGRRSIDDMIDRIQRYGGVTFGPIGAPDLEVENHASGVVWRVSRSWPDPAGGSARPGIYTEWGPDGSLRRFTDTASGSVRGVDVTWDGAGVASISSGRMP